MAPKAPHFAAKAKAVIFLFMVGGPSQMETFDPKPVLDKLHGQQMPASFGEVKSQFVKQGTPLMGSHWKLYGLEFGRTPVSENGKGRDHNPTAFSMWMAGGGVKGGQVIGQTDEIGFKTAGDRYHPRDIHATILRLLGLDQMKLTYLNNGRNERLTDFGGNVIERMIR